MTTPLQQLAMPGFEPPVKPRQLHLLYWEAFANHWAPIVERIASERELGPEGITERDLAGVPDWLDLDEFRRQCDERGVPYR